jgi:hypothetical protein
MSRFTRASDRRIREIPELILPWSRLLSTGRQVGSSSNSPRFTVTEQLDVLKVLSKSFRFKSVNGNDRGRGDRVHETDDVGKQHVSRRVNFDESPGGGFEFLSGRFPI